MIRTTRGAGEQPFAICLLLGIAYASSIGGIGTIIGTAPNVFVVSFVKEQLGREIGFFEWMRFGVPLVIVFLPLAWLLLTRVLFRLAHINLPEAASYLRNERAALRQIIAWGIFDPLRFPADDCYVDYTTLIESNRVSTTAGRLRV